MENFEVFPGYRIKNTLNADLECLLNLRGLSGNSGSYPFYDCLCTQAARDKPKSERSPCQERTVEDCKELHHKWKEETNENKKKAAQFKNCINKPLLQRSFSNANTNLPLLHITTGLGNHDLEKLVTELFSFDANFAILYVDPTNKKGSFWDFVRFKKIEMKIAELSKSKDSAPTLAAKRALNIEMKTLEDAKTTLFGKELPKLTKKTSLMIKLLNKSLTEKGVKREKYWSASLTGNNIQKFLYNAEEIITIFTQAIDSHYLTVGRTSGTESTTSGPESTTSQSESTTSRSESTTSRSDALLQLKQKLGYYKALFVKYRMAYKLVNHHSPVSPTQCDDAQAAIDHYLDYAHHTFNWKTTPNKAHYLQERVVKEMRRRGVGLTQFSEQGMESGNQARKRVAEFTRHMNPLAGLGTNACRLMVDKSLQGDLEQPESTTSRPESITSRPESITSRPESISSRPE